MNICNCSLGKQFLHFFQFPFTFSSPVGFLVSCRFFFFLCITFSLTLSPFFSTSSLHQFLLLDSDQIYFCHISFLPYPLHYLSIYLILNFFSFFPYLTHSGLPTCLFFTINSRSSLFLFMCYISLFSSLFYSLFFCFLVFIAVFFPPPFQGQRLHLHFS